MSIAVSLVLRASRAQRVLLLVYVCVQLGAALALARPASLACVAAAALAARRAWLPARVRRIDISGLGQIRLTVQQKQGEGVEYEALQTLLPGSTFWPFCLLLRLKDENGRPMALAIFADSVTCDQFRALSVALAAIAHKII